MIWFSAAWIAVAALAAVAWVIYYNRTVHRTVGLLKKTLCSLERLNRVDTDDASSRDSRDGVPTESETPGSLRRLEEPVPRKIIHDLNNLVGTITGFADAALEDLPPTHPVRDDIKEILEAAIRAKDVIGQLNAYAPKPSAPGAKLEFAAPSAAHPALTPHQDAQSGGSSLISKDLSARSASSGPANEADVPRGNEHLIIVDDEIALLRMLSRFFENLGYRVTAFSRSVEALETFESTSQDYDLAILDQRMPEMSGASLAAAMLRIRPELPIVVLSGHTESLTPADAARIGIRRFLSKPIPQPALGVTIRDVLDDSAGIR